MSAPGKRPGRTFRTSDEVDFVIVGSGAAGGVMARELSQAGFDVLVLEQGPRLSYGDFDHDELEHWALWKLASSAPRSPQTFRRTEHDEAVVPPGYPPLLYARLVGGSSTHFTANFWRFHPIDFVEKSRIGSIAGTGLEDWPITYDELEPYYTKVEWEVGVSGQAGAYPGEPPRSKGYPMPPLPVKSSGVLFEQGARAVGLHPFPAPMAIASRPYRGRPSCIHCGFCMAFGCEVGAKSSTLYTMIPEAEATGRCEVRSGSYVFRVETDRAGRATGVVYFDAEGNEQRQKAKTVILCANGGESARLLFLSETGRFPDGLANSSGLVGKYLMWNGQSFAGGTFEHELNEYKSVQVTRILLDYYDSDPKRGFYGGGGMDARVFYHPIWWALEGTDRNAPNWGSEYKQRLRDYTRSFYVNGHTTSLPLETNNVTLDPNVKDAWGIPVMRVTYRDHDDDLAMMRFFQDRGVEILEAAGAERTWKQPVAPQNLGAHLLGTCRMGNDPASSVVDRYHRAHDVPNLFICDGSSFVTSGRGQPTETIQALAFRAAEYIGRFASNGEI
jgi:choline dehydrogenase-like flavoprotein